MMWPLPLTGGHLGGQGRRCGVFSTETTRSIMEWRILAGVSSSPSLYGTLHARRSRCGMAAERGFCLAVLLSQPAVGRPTRLPKGCVGPLFNL